MSTQTKELWNLDDGATPDVYEKVETSMATDLQPYQAPNPLTMLEAALERGVAPEQLGQMMDLCERHERTVAKKAYAEAMNACQQEMPAVVRNKKNTHTNSLYADLEAVHSAIKPIYLKHGFSLSHGCGDSPLEGHCRCVCDVTHIGGHTERFFLDLPPDGAGFKGTSNKTPVQAIASSMSYGQRYLEARIFNITYSLDNDGNRPVQVINGEQEIEILQLIERKNANKAGLLKWLGVELISGIPAHRFQEVINALRSKPDAT